MSCGGPFRSLPRGRGRPSHSHRRGSGCRRFEGCGAGSGSVYESPVPGVHQRDRIGTEICAALKNVIALCAGCTDGMGCGDNTKALLMTRGLAEMARLGVALGGRKETFIGLAGVGDLIVTCTSMHSRNRRYGILIGQGKSVPEALEEIGAVVEGYYAAANARSLAQKAGVEMPISQAAYEVLYNGRDVHAVIADPYEPRQAL